MVNANRAACSVLIRFSVKATDDKKVVSQDCAPAYDVEKRFTSASRTFHSLGAAQSRTLVPLGTS